MRRFLRFEGATCFGGVLCGLRNFAGFAVFISSLSTLVIAKRG